MIRSLLRLSAALALVLPACAQTLETTFGAHLGNSQALQGDQQSISPMVLTVLTNETHALISMNMTTTSMSKAGYVAIGYGTSMSSADIVVAWPNNDGSWTLSHRSSSGHRQPSPVATQPTAADLALIPDLTTNSSSSPYAAVAFLRPLTVSAAYAAGGSGATLQRAAGQSFIYAASSRNPGSNSQSATIVQHDDGAFGSIKVDLSKVVTAATVATAAPATVVSAPWSRRDSIIVLHALCGCLAWLIFAPAAVLLARIGRSFQGWFRLHQLLQNVLVGALTLAAVVLGAVAVNEGSGVHGNSLHKRLGYAVLALMLVQFALGYWAHALFDAKRTKRPVRNVLHIVIGITLIVLGYIQAYKGFGAYARTTPGYVLAAYWVSLAGFVIVYVFSCLRLAQVRHEQGMSWSRAAGGLGRDEHFGRLGSMGRKSPSGEKRIGELDYFAQPDPIKHGNDLKLQPVESLATHDRMSPTPPLRLNNPTGYNGFNGASRPGDGRTPAFDAFSRPGWQTFNRTDTDLPYADNRAPSQRLPTAYPHFGVAK